MDQITIQNSTENIGNRFDLILTAARLARKMQFSKKETLMNDKYHKCTVLALKEIEKKFFISK